MNEICQYFLIGSDILKRGRQGTALATCCKHTKMGLKVVSLAVGAFIGEEMSSMLSSARHQLNVAINQVENKNICGNNYPCIRESAKSCPYGRGFWSLPNHKKSSHEIYSSTQAFFAQYLVSGIVGNANTLDHCFSYVKMNSRQTRHYFMCSGISQLTYSFPKTPIPAPSPKLAKNCTIQSPF